MFGSAKQSITIASKQFVKEITDEGWDDSEHIEQKPTTCEVSGNFQGSGGKHKTTVVFDQQKGVNSHIKNLVFLHQLLSQLSLHRREHKQTLWISFDDEIHCTIAEITDPVEDHNVAFLGHSLQW